jgi:hypothetical protein
MVLRSARALALISALSTMLLGMPLLSAAVVHEAWSSDSIASPFADFDSVAESASESVEVEEEREEESEPKTQFFFGHGSDEAAVSRCQGSVRRVNAPILPECWPRIVAIRGPPAA